MRHASTRSAFATDCYVQKWRNATYSCDDGSRGYTHGDTLEYTDPDGNSGTVEPYGDRYYQHDNDGNNQFCTQTGSTVTCE
jgi:hypothetical protein